MKNIYAKLPLIFMGLLGLALIILAINRLKNCRGLMLVVSIVYLALCLLLVVIEIWASKREGRRERAEQDRGTFEVCALGMGLIVLSGLLLPIWWKRLGIWTPIAILLLIIGITVRISAIVTLGKYYSPRVRIVNNHSIISSGPYYFVRHPAYLGLFLCFLGFVIFFFNIFGLLFFFGVLLPGLVSRIKAEEKTLATIPEYREYCIGRKRLIPFIW